MRDNKEFTAITILKGIFCLSILLHHAAAGNAVTTGLLGWFAQYGGVACSFFFVISGFLLCYRYKPVESIGDWYALVQRRVLHLLPIHYITLFFCIAVFLVTGRSLAGYTTGFWGTLPSLFLVQDWIPYHPEIRQCWDGVAWYISVLFFCYLVYPFIFNHAKVGLSMLTVCYYIVIAVMLFNVVHIDAGNFIYHLPPARLLEFALGGGAAYCLRNGSRRFIYAILPLVVLGLILVPTQPTAAIGFSLAPLFVILLYILLATSWPTAFSRTMNFLLCPFTLLGKISFEIYMFHAILLSISITIIHKVLHSNNILLMILLTLLSTILASLLWRKLSQSVKSVQSVVKHDSFHSNKNRSCNS